jgi:hypothetical protein
LGSLRTFRGWNTKKSKLIVPEPPVIRRSLTYDEYWTERNQHIEDYKKECSELGLDYKSSPEPTYSKFKKVCHISFDDYIRTLNG